MKDRLVTLFGGSGFIGRYAAQALLRAGAQVRFAERDPRRAYRLKPLGGLGQSQFVAADLLRPDTIARAIEGADGVVNLVGVFGSGMARVHVEGARTIAAAAAKAGVEALVHVSALGADAGSPAAYARTKGEGEQAVRAAFPNATILRPSTVFGQEDQFLNRFAQLIARAPVVPVLRPGVRFQPVFVADVADAIRLAATEPGRFGGMTAELAGPDTLSMAELFHWLGATLHRRATFVELPDMVGAAIARAGFLPGAPISWDQWLMLQHDNVAGGGAPGLAAFGVAPTPLGSVAPAWLVRYRRQGRFNRRPAELASPR
ncbi:complex I NDUFA9 subunit family protein [uncultured Sphingomonas sp.]|uniref:complex I NDUFA9 subunit family protein n=1 Tax=uncultured Sphingomonas sp. TaxID=158754 RepID=UPI0035CB3E59